MGSSSVTAARSTTATCVSDCNFEAVPTCQPVSCGLLQVFLPQFPPVCPPFLLLLWLACSLPDHARYRPTLMPCKLLEVS